MKKKKKLIPEFRLPPKLYYILLGLIFLMSFFTRFLTFSNVKKDGQFYLKGSDAYYFVRQAENVSFGGIPKTDPFLCYPVGFSSEEHEIVYPYMIAALGKVIPLEAAAAFLSPVCGILAILGIFLILKELFPKNDFAVIGGTAIGALTGIQFISRSYFGFGDRHIVETMFFLFGIFLLMHSWRKKQWFWPILSAISFITYSFTWSHAYLMIGIIILGLFLTETFLKELPQFFFRNTYINLGIQCIIFLISGYKLLVILLLLSIIILLTFQFLRRRINSLPIRIVFSSIVLFGGFLMMYFVNKSDFLKIFNTIKDFILIKNSDSLYSEMLPVWKIYNKIGNPWSRIALQIILYGVSILGLLYGLFKKNLFICTAGIILAILSILHIRTEYYFQAFIAVGCAFITLKYKKFAWVCIVFGILFTISYWTFELKYNKESSLAFTRADYLMAAWMKENLPDAGVQKAGKYSENSIPQYGVIANWESGYLYAYLAQQPMVATPNLCNSLSPDYLNFFQNEQDAAQFMQSNNFRYVLVKPFPFQMYYSRAQSIGLPTPKIVALPYKGDKILFADEGYYKSMFSRLYNFNGKAYSPFEIYIVTSSGILEKFADYDKAAKVENTNGHFYGTNIFKSPVPLEDLKYFKLIHEEDDGKNKIKLFEFIPSN